MTDTGNPTISFETKSQLAKLLATENISVQHNPNAKTAYFDIKNRNLVLPVWQNISDDLYDMLVVHEVGHALDTPEKEWQDGIKNIVHKIHGGDNNRAFLAVKDFMNVIEDARIDKRQKRRYPGSRKNYIAGYKELLQKNFFGTNDLNINELPLIDRINIHFKVGIYNQIVKFTSEEKTFVDRIAAAETFDEVIQLTEEVYAYAQQKKEEESKLKNESNDFNDEESEDESEDGDESFFDQSDSDESDVSDNSPDNEDDLDSDEEGEEADGTSDEESDDESEEIDSDETIAGKSEDDTIPESFTEEASRKAMNNIIVNSDYNYVYASFPKFNIDKIVDDFNVVLKDVEAELTLNKSSFNSVYYEEVLGKLNEFLNKEKDAISFMVKEFEMKKAADIHSRISVAKTGVLDTNKLYAHKYNEDIFRKLAVLPQGKNHGFVMLLDWSGSMRGDLEHTLKQLFSLTGFCKRVGIPFEVYIFRSAEGHDAAAQGCYSAKDLNHKQFNYKTGSIMFDAFKLRNVLSSRMNTVQYKKAQQYLWLSKDAWFRSDTMNSTPLNQALYVASELVNQFRIRSKVQIVNTIVLTDGESDPIHSYLFNHDEIMKPFRNDPQASQKKGELFFVRDEITGKTYELSGLSWSSITYKSTKMFLDMLRNRTNTTTIGFYQFSGGYKKLCNCLYNYGFIDSLKNQKAWKDDKFVSLNTAGYDEYYVVNCKQLLNDTDKLDVNATMTKAKIAKEFIRFSGKKSLNRLLLSKFIGRIANVYKKVA